MGLAGLGAAIFVGYYLVNNLGTLTSYGYGQQAYYFLLVILGIAAAFFLFGALRSTASMKGTQFGMAIDLGGPAALFFFVIKARILITKTSA
jgi:hypothetical protein